MLKSTLTPCVLLMFAYTFKKMFLFVSVQPFLGPYSEQYACAKCLLVCFFSETWDTYWQRGTDTSLRARHIIDLPLWTDRLSLQVVGLCGLSPRVSLHSYPCVWHGGFLRPSALLCCPNITSSVGVEVLVTSSLDHRSLFLFVVVLLHTSLGRLKIEYDCQTENSVSHVPFLKYFF